MFIYNMCLIIKLKERIFVFEKMDPYGNSYDNWKTGPIVFNSKRFFDQVPGHLSNVHLPFRYAPNPLPKPYLNTMTKTGPEK